MKASTRKYIYGIAIAAIPLAISLGLITSEIAPTIVAIVGAVLVPGLALANTPSDE